MIFTCEIVLGVIPISVANLVVGARPNAPIKPNPAGALKNAAGLDLSAEYFLYLGVLRWIYRQRLLLECMRQGLSGDSGKQMN